VSRLVPHAPVRLLRSEDGFAVGKGVAHTLADPVRFFARDREDVREAAVRLVCVIGAPRGGTQYVAGCFILESRKEAGLRGRWKGYSKLTRVKKPTEKLMNGGPRRRVCALCTDSQTPAGFHSNPSKQWVIAIHYKEEVSPS
jgi:hypothetical protein